MAKYLQRCCPKCNGYLGIVIPERKQAINGRCLKCGKRLAWVLVRVKPLLEAKAHDVQKLVSSSRRQLNQILRSPSVIPKVFMRVVTAAVFSVLIL